MNDKQLTLRIANDEAIRRNNLATKGYFDNPSAIRTVNIEQEVQILDSDVKKAGIPVNAEKFLKTNSIGARPDTSTFIVEYDGSDHPEKINSKGLKNLAVKFLNRTIYIQKRIPKNTILVSIGANPVLTEDDSDDWLVKTEPKYSRYIQIDSNAFSENPVKSTNIVNPLTGKAIKERASSIKGMFRVTGTQFHISENSVDDALDSHRTSIAVAPFMIAAFGNSPFLAGIDTGRNSSRVELLRQTEQLRSGLPKPANSLLEYYEEILTLNTPFVCTDNPVKALDEVLSAVHTVSRIRVILNKSKGVIRNEFRHIDSQSPYKSMQALFLTLGCIEAFRFSDERPSYKESKIDFQNSVWGLKTKMHWNKKLMTVQELGLYFIEKSLKIFKKIGLYDIVFEYLDPLKDEIKLGITQSDFFRKTLNYSMTQGASFKQALNMILKSLNKDALRKII
ncbi:MAG: hypothetical protein US74_C0034G0013 [Parcubacteria group bacterium GW2011_GWA2_38_13]|uniref:Uncharacterized protein n=1 Tax=Candidatus Roizmanbacteria bacterium GW2011_GWC2_35_12 TaxID=1618485 RepID=A0A0G0B8H8_9BACT|nr:MAG: hypothetical protein UR63_C0047G0007 [Candidatus Roizmanbacteria bacterium GW2011_GWC2_35_12]KKQ55348.1 MAG: hypothetical protein US74_C0034G0013 [Parcubacteria group bacterium GW2011_GWA2_38_13]